MQSINQPVCYSLQGLSLVFSLVFSLGCSEALRDHSAYDFQRNLCTDEYSEQWGSLVEECRVAWERDRSCGGVISFSGMLDGHFVTLEGFLTSTTFLNATLGDDETHLRDRITMRGRGVYFDYQVVFKHVGVPLVWAEPVTLTLEERGNDDTYWLRDTMADASIRISAGGDSEDLNGRPGTLTLRVQRADEVSGSFEGSFEHTDHVESGAYTPLTGCFHAFATERLLERL